MSVFAPVAYCGACRAFFSVAANPAFSVVHRGTGEAVSHHDATSGVELERYEGAVPAGWPLSR